MIQEETAEAGGEARDDSGQATPAQDDQNAQKTQKAEAAEPPTPAAPAAPAQAAPAPAGPPKSQLRRRVEERIAELEAALEKVAEDPAPAKQKQARAIAMALKGAHDWMNPSNEKMGPLESAQMSRWLVSTQYLGQGS